MRSQIGLFAAGVLCAWNLHAQVTITNGYVKQMRPSSKATAYMDLENKGTAVQLLKVESPDVPRIEIHQHVRGEDGTMKMRKLEKLTLPAHGVTRLKPGSLHVMLFDFQSLQNEVLLIFKFSDDESISVKLPVEVMDISTTQPRHHG